MNAYLVFCLSVVAIASFVFWWLRPRKCRDCGGTGKRMIHDGAESDFHYAACNQCGGTGWKV
ncbi:MAG: hypothetical protein AB7V14_09625 [Kiritimatiellia bacterium]